VTKSAARCDPHCAVAKSDALGQAWRLQGTLQRQGGWQHVLVQECRGNHAAGSNLSAVLHAASSGRPPVRVCLGRVREGERESERERESVCVVTVVTVPLSLVWTKVGERRRWWLSVPRDAPHPGVMRGSYNTSANPRAHGMHARTHTLTHSHTHNAHTRTLSVLSWSPPLTHANTPASSTDAHLTHPTHQRWQKATREEGGSRLPARGLH
jgi:hypothetical protein